MIGDLPKTLTVGGVEYTIDTDYRNVLRIFEAFQDSKLTQEEKWIVAIFRLFDCFYDADDVIQAVQDGFPIKDAVEQSGWFISVGKEQGKEIELRVFDWVQDEQMIFSSVNKVAGCEVRALPYLHWWTFLGYFDEIGEGKFSFIVGIRNKRNLGKKLDNHEKEFYKNNKVIVDLKKILTKEEQEEKDRQREIWENML